MKKLKHKMDSKKNAKMTVRSLHQIHTAPPIPTHIPSTLQD